MARLKRIIFIFLPLVFAVFPLSFVSANTVGSHVMLLTIDEAIGPATDDYIERALQTAASERAELVVIRMDTPGGLDSAMRGIIKNITNLGDYA